MKCRILCAQPMIAQRRPWQEIWSFCLNLFFLENSHFLVFSFKPQTHVAIREVSPKAGAKHGRNTASGVCVNSLKNLKATLEISRHSLCWHLPELSSLGDLSGCILHLYRTNFAHGWLRGVQHRVFIPTSTLVTAKKFLITTESLGAMVFSNVCGLWPASLTLWTCDVQS